MREITFIMFYKILKLLELVSYDKRFKFVFDWDQSEQCFSIDMSFEDGNFKMRDYTNMYLNGDGEFDDKKFEDLYSGIRDYLEKVNKIINTTWIEDYLKDLKAKK